MRRKLVVGGVVLGALALVGAALVSPDVTVEALAPTLTDGRSKFLELEGMRVHYRVEGSGPPLVLLHGSSSSLHTWEGWAQALSGEHQVIRLDLPGYGLTGPRPDRRYDSDRDVAFLAAFLDALGVKQAAVAGNSLGGYLAWRFAARYPERVSKLVLVDAAGFPRPGKAPLPFRLARVPVLSEVLRYVSPRPLVEKSVREVYGDPSRVTPELVDRYLALTLRAGNRQAFVDRANLDWVDRTAELAKVTAPTLILWGGRDHWIDPADAARFQQALRGSRVVRYPELGHVPMEEDPGRTAADVRAFLSEK